ncbi:MAG: alpha/beta hydrolase [Elusimicrobiaceae bacterium]|nr:alpha/beta hydrolase [Elusimicrobiaceae bacterium]
MTTQKRTAGNNPRLRRLLLSFAGAAVLAGGYYLLVRQLAYRMTYHFDTVIKTTPDTIGLRYSPVELDFKGRHVSGWYLPAARADGPTVLYCHGNAGNISGELRLCKARLLHDMGLGVLMFDYGGFGQSRGKASEAGLRADARAMYYRLAGMGIEPGRIILYGESLGTAVACALATEVNAAALILESPFTSLADMGRATLPWLPAGPVLGDSYATLRRIAEIKMPLLIFHSREDEVVPFSQARRNYEAAREPKTFIELSGGHSDGFRSSGPVYTAGLKRFLLERLGFDAAAGRYVRARDPGVKIERTAGVKLNLKDLKNRG